MVKRMAMARAFFMCLFARLQMRPGVQGHKAVESQLQRLLCVSKYQNGMAE